MGNYLITVTDLEKPIIRKDIIVEKEIVEDVSEEHLGMLVVHLLDEIEAEREDESVEGLTRKRLKQAVMRNERKEKKDGE